MRAFIVSRLPYCVRILKNISGASVEGFDTYAYYKGNDILRSWICIPLTVGIDERAEATINALFSPRLWTENGLLTQAGSDTFWDRSTLYALRGVYAVGETEKRQSIYIVIPLPGCWESMPYAIEAWPEGGQRHLSAESGLYGRIITEGLFGIRPTGFNSFILTPQGLLEVWSHMALRKIGAFGSKFDIEIDRLPNNRLQVKIINGNKIQQHFIKVGNKLTIKLK